MNLRKELKKKEEEEKRKKGEVIEKAETPITKEVSH